MELGIIIDIAKIIKEKCPIKALKKECDKAKQVATAVIKVVQKLQSELKQQRRQNRTPLAGIRGPVNGLKEGVEEINKVITICRDQPLKAKVLSNTYIAKLRSATSKINDAMNALGGANAAMSLQIQRELQTVNGLKEGVEEIHKVITICRDQPLKAKVLSNMYIAKLRSATSKINDAMSSLVEGANAAMSLQIQRELETVSGALGSIQDLPAEVAREVRDAIRSEIELLPFMLQNGLATDVEDAKEQLAELQEEKNELLSENLLIDRDLIQMVCNLSIAELAQQQPTTQFQDPEVPASFKCPLSLEIMEDPVSLYTESGHTFERSWLQQALDRDPYQDPMTGLRYGHKLTFGPNRSLKDAIEEWKQKTNYHSASAQRPPSPPHRIPEPPRRPFGPFTPSLFPQPQFTPPPVLFAPSFFPPREPVAPPRRPRRHFIPCSPNRLPEHLLSRWEWLRELADDNQDLTELDLRKKKIGDEGAKALAEALGTNFSLQQLGLAGNNIGDEGARAIAYAFEPNSMYMFRTFQKLDLSGNNIGAEGAKALATALATETSFRPQELWLNGNNIGAEGAKALATALGTNPSLQTLELPPFRIALAETFATNTSLQKLDLSANNIGVEGAIAIGRALATNTSLKALNLGANNIGVEGAKALATALGTNTSLQKLWLGGNNIGDEGANAIGRALRTNTSLQQLDLGGNNIGDEGANAIGRGLGTNTSLQELHLESNNISSLRKIKI
eukprot:CAMPEP_0197301422 /NCGR_PEP_ID=MMETSP0890-20130614/50389_1 /TAXON_ID=44058 ORGANISM="Aureoumbra lagunensis, Strain CCMP1510" /NCGR_SAMPLE_ID=MMETSP0890 /ASSEMBLY_ACC=CAM_ASM_000533 /LENGTH=734 /DNA_ID=CAMNT_0042780721 /DNA_START=433 /DNA_END=2636 /DNA_ORIENTATION=-